MRPSSRQEHDPVVIPLGIFYSAGSVVVREQSLFYFGKTLRFGPPLGRLTLELFHFLKLKREIPTETRKNLCCYRENRLF